ncbi:hypothetical protein PhCBS80983_g03206 [Powellomyces hirtus]|uniref:polynucleotide adenylyltransferase n=1 Tax=Powellomyces hirtus TaxID=109895 RepID=A0A507E4V4_9FUNG|nr:hypothetical protein PhCBS80983_g03206 [Powellomyces hirtus]
MNADGSQTNHVPTRDELFAKWLAGLHAEIRQFAQTHAMTKSDQMFRQWILTKVALPVPIPMPINRTYGVIAGLILPSSDIDLALHYADPNKVQSSSRLGTSGFDETFGEPERDRDMETLRRLQEAILDSTLPLPSSVRLVPASVPVLKLQEKTTCILIDITINNKDGAASSRQINSWIEGYEPLFPMTLLIKHYLYAAGLNDTYTGGFGSFLVVNLLVFLFKQQPALLDRPHRYAILLLAFLRFYGTLFDYSKWGISAFTGRPFLLATDTRDWDNKRRSDAGAFPLVVEDPTNPKHDIGRSGYHAANVLQRFRDDFKRLLEIFARYVTSKNNPTDNNRASDGDILLTWLGSGAAEVEAGFHARRQFISNLHEGIESCTSF